MADQFRVVRRELYPGRHEYGIAMIPKESWQGPPKMIIEFRNFGDDHPIGRLRHMITSLKKALGEPVVNFKDLG